MFVRKDLLATKYKVDMMAANKFKRYRFDSFEKQDSRTEEKEELWYLLIFQFDFYYISKI